MGCGRLNADRAPFAYLNIEQNCYVLQLLFMCVNPEEPTVKNLFWPRRPAIKEKYGSAMLEKETQGLFSYITPCP